MRCLNCSTVVADTDTRCMTCGMSTGIRPASANPLAGKGGAISAVLIGGLIAFAATVRLVNGAPEPPTPPKRVKADELLSVKDVGSLPDPWIVYDASNIIETR